MAMTSDQQVLDAAKFLKSCQNESLSHVQGLIAPAAPNLVQFSGFVIQEPHPLAATSAQALEDMYMGYWQVVMQINADKYELKGRFSMRNPIDTMRKEIAEAMMKQIRDILANLIAPEFMKFTKR